MKTAFAMFSVLVVCGCTTRLFDTPNEFVSWVSGESSYASSKQFGEYTVKGIIATSDYALARQLIILKRCGINDSDIQERIRNIKPYYADKYQVILEISFNNDKTIGKDPYNTALNNQKDINEFVRDNDLNLTDKVALINGKDKTVYPLQATMQRSYESSPKTVIVLIFEGERPHGKVKLKIGKLLNIDQGIELVWDINTEKYQLTQRMQKEIGLL